MAEIQLKKRESALAKPFPRKREIFFYFSLGAVVGLLVFLFTYGTAVLHVQNDAWIFTGGDLEQTYIGWQAFRNTAWSFPFGLMDTLANPYKVSVLYIDSVPIMGIFFKILSPILPSTFQYIGIWTLFSYIMQGGISSLLIRHYTKSKFLCTIIPLFFITADHFQFRAFGHTALTAHWLVLFALLLWIYKDYFSSLKRKYIFWVPLLFITPLIHSYFTPIVFLIMLGFVLEDTIKYKNYLENILLLVSTVAAIFLALYLFGAFSGTVAVSQQPYGDYSANLATFFDSDMPDAKALLVPSIGHFSLQYEGSVYLGLGVIILLVISLGVMVYKWIRQKGSFKAFFTLRVKCMIFLMIAMFIFAVSNVIAFGPNYEVTIPLPDFILRFLSIFRASGRFTWPIWYLLVIFIVRTIIQNFKPRTAKIILCVCLIIQLIDISPVIKVRRERYSTLQVTAPRGAIYAGQPWQDLAEENTEIVFLFSYDEMRRSYEEEMFLFTEFAMVNDMPVNEFYLSRRVKEELLQEYRYEVSHPYKEGIIYIINKENEYPELNLYLIDDKYTIGTVNDLDLEQYDNTVKISSAKK